SFFFFQAEDGIRDRNVTGVQTCALPISTGVWWYLRLFRRPNHVGPESARRARGRLERRLQARLRRRQKYRLRYFLAAQQHYVQRSEERRVGQEPSTGRERGH